jgi:two-component system phosphate regulon sensor histidine kinase PhoR
MRSLRFRIALAYAALIVLAMAALGATLLRVEERRFRRAVDERLLAEARLAAEAVRPVLQSGSGRDALAPLVRRLSEASGARITVIEPNGTVLGDSARDPRQLDNHANRPEVRDALTHGVGFAGRRSDTLQDDVRYAAVAVRDDTTTLAVVRAATPVSALVADLRRIALSIAVAAVAATTCAIALAVVIAGAVTVPLQRLRQAVRSLAVGRLDQRVPAGGGAEVADVAAAFNEMAAQLRATVETLGQERSRLEALLAASADAFLALDRCGVIRYLNPAARALFGNADGRQLVEAARNHELNALLHAALATGDLCTATVHLAHVDRWMQATIAPIAGGGEWTLLVSLLDITDVRQAATSRRDFVANVSHELRTPLAGIKAVVETLRDGAIRDPAAADEFLARVDAEVDRLVQLVEELLHLARIESGAAPLHLVDVAPRALIAPCVDRFRPTAERAGVELTLDVPDSLPAVRADPERLGQALGNLIHNAIKFTPPGGRVAVGGAQANGQVQISVTDTGSGIDAVDLPRIFERFYVADRARSGRGTGLGLAIVKHVVRAHGGTVDAQSALGRGSTFTISLPAAVP